MSVNKNVTVPEGGSDTLHTIRSPDGLRTGDASQPACDLVVMAEDAKFVEVFVRRHRA
jgi:hypothetical protein